MTRIEKQGHRPVRDVDAALFVSPPGAADGPDELVRDAHDATEANRRGVSR